MTNWIPTVAVLLFLGFSTTVGDQVNITQIGVRQPSAKDIAHGASTHHIIPISSSQNFHLNLDRDLIFWGLKVRDAHQTYAYFSQPISESSTSNLGRNQLFQSLLNGEIWTLATDYYAKRLYYTDHISNFIGIYDLQTRKTLRNFQGMAWGIDSLSVDWISGNVYWSDSNFDRIMVADRNFTYYRSMFSIESRTPAKVAVHPGRRLYWTEKRNADCRIYRSSLDGYSKQLLYKFRGVQTITDIVIDYVNVRLYWSERLKTRGSIGRIRYINLKSRKRRTIQDVYSESGTYFFGLASYKNHLYVSDDHGKKLLVIDKETKQVVFRYDFKFSEVPRGISVFSAYEYPISKDDEKHQCLRGNPCEQICLARYGVNQFSCQCSTGFSIQPDGKSCRARMIKDDFAILLDSKHSKMYQLNLRYPVEPQEIKAVNLTQPISVAYDWVSETVIWADEASRTISRVSLYGGNQKTLIRDTRVFSIALDVQSRNMYWVDSLKDAVFVSNLNGSYVHTLHIEGLYRVWAMAIDHSRGYLYWSDWGQVGVNGAAYGVIKTSRLDGTSVEVIVKTGATPHGLTLEHDKNILFWTMIKENAIGWMDMNDGTVGKYKLPFFWQAIPTLPFPTGIAYWEDYLFITDLSMKHVLRVSVRDVMKAINQTGAYSEVISFGPRMFYQLAGIHVYDNSTRKGSDVCGNSNCPHLCLPGPDGNPKCVCQDHFRYIESNNSCIQESSTGDTTPPTFGDTCPLDMQIVTDECSEKAEIDFVEPTASDDSNLPVTMKSSVKTTEFPMTLSEGSRIFTYVAVDRSHNAATCRFRVDVIVRRCYHITVKEIPAEAELGETSCGEKIGSVVNVTCPGIPGIAYQYKCAESTDWEAIGPETCDRSAITVSPVSTTTSASTPRSTKNTTHTPSYISRGGKHGGRNLITRGSKYGEWNLATILYKIKQKTDSDDKALLQNVAGKAPYDSTGLTIGLVLSFLVLIALIVAAVILIRRRKAKGSVPVTNWNRTDDQVQLTGANTESGIYLGERDSPGPFGNSNDDNLVL